MMRKALSFLLIICLYSSLYAQEVSYVFPKDKRYWDFHKWYVNHSVLSLVVSGEDGGHLKESLEALKKLKKSGVLIGEILVIGNEPSPLLSGKKPVKGKNYLRQTDKILLELESEDGLDSSMVNAQAVVDRLNIKYSPTWVVRYRGKNYIYEGLRSPARLFTSRGEFRAAN
jgi:hypothetical protein